MPRIDLPSGCTSFGTGLMKRQVVASRRGHFAGNRRGRAGYTLMEIMLVVAIIAVLVDVATVYVNDVVPAVPAP